MWQNANDFKCPDLVVVPIVRNWTPASGTFGSVGCFLPVSICGHAGVEKTPMLKWALIFLVISIVAGALGFSGIAQGAATIARVLFGLFLILFILFLILILTGINVFS